MATGPGAEPRVPAVAAALPPGIARLTALDYRRPAQLGPGGVLVVGASASGVQIADELRRSGRQVTLAVGEHIRLPRTYRGRDIHWWLDAIGQFDERHDEVADLARARRLPSPQLIGSASRRTLDLGALSAAGVEIVGRLVGVAGRRAQFSGSLAAVVAAADLKQDRLLARIDAQSPATVPAAGSPHRSGRGAPGSRRRRPRWSSPGSARSSGRPATGRPTRGWTRRCSTAAGGCGTTAACWPSRACTRSGCR